MQNYQQVHFIGIGGIGISALAYLALEEGKKVTGSDIADSALINDLQKNGAHISIGHDNRNIIDDTELVIYSEAIDPDTNPEYLKAKSMGLPLLSYFQALGQISKTKKTIAVIGTHGKTTTTAMLGLTLIKAGLDPTVIVGSKLKEFSYKNVYIGKGDLLIVEACEYRRSFLNLEPFGAVLLNCEAEHLDYYKDEQDYLNAYIELIKKIPATGFLVANMDDKNVEQIVKNCVGKVIPIQAKDWEALGLRLQVMGDFNQLNALHAYKTAEMLGADTNKIRQSLEEFNGTWRRMELKGKFNEALLIDDYGHHPTEIQLTLKAIKQKYPKKRLICVFQPHQYSRTHLMLGDFEKAFRSADKVIVTDIYAARDSEMDRAKINSEKLADIIRKNHMDVTWGKDLTNTFHLLKNGVGKNDVLVTMGAGDISNLAEKLAE